MNTCNATEIPELSRYAAQRLVRLLPAFKAAERRTGLPLALLLAVARVESNYVATAVSSAGARGIMQIMPTTFEALDKANGGGHDIWSAADSIKLGSYYLDRLVRRFPGDWVAAIAAYNCGAGYVSKNGPGTCRGYAEAVLKWWARFEYLAACPEIYALGDGAAPSFPSPPASPGPVVVPRPSGPVPAVASGGGAGGLLLLLLAAVWGLRG